MFWVLSGDFFEMGGDWVFFFGLLCDLNDGFFVLGFG